MPSGEVAARVTWVLTSSRPWKYMTMRRAAASTWTSGEAMCGVVASNRPSCDIGTPRRSCDARSRAATSGATSGGSVRKCESAICRLPGGWIVHGPSRSSAYANRM